ncbi:MAG TPA: hypothetical protein VH583_01875 [Vicinamibacterales bacterium]|jgi:hypothetical protein
MRTKSLALGVLLAVTSLGAGAGQWRQVDQIMREKLGLAQKILEAVVTSDWVALETTSRDLERLVDDPRWAVLNYPEYGRHSAEFRKSIQKLNASAARRDLDATPDAYVAVTLQCVACHRYLARARIANPPLQW